MKEIHRLEVATCLLMSGNSKHWKTDNALFIVKNLCNGLVAMKRDFYDFATFKACVLTFL